MVVAVGVVIEPNVDLGVEGLDVVDRTSFRCRDQVVDARIEGGDLGDAARRRLWCPLGVLQRSPPGRYLPGNRIRHRGRWVDKAGHDVAPASSKLPAGASIGSACCG